ncbi:unnamed protein product [Prorocentrum cordatum]|uniref:Uncharacterized protein n=1 Tax=Prorocentrum cordatum TaxID=2364126 RepID=A0ABN9VAX8_9DINO|nr:unnamed protein product [Polarella glacialis]
MASAGAAWASRGLAGGAGRRRAAAPAALSARRGFALRAGEGRGAQRRAQYAEDPRGKTFAERGYVARDAPRSSRLYPRPEGLEPPARLPGGRKQVSVELARSDVDGFLEAQVVLATRTGHKLFWLSEEELGEIEKLAPRLNEYLQLWQEKAALAREARDGRDLAPRLEQAQRERLLE